MLCHIFEERYTVKGGGAVHIHKAHHFALAYAHIFLFAVLFFNFLVAFPRETVPCAVSVKQPFKGIIRVKITVPVILVLSIRILTVRILGLTAAVLTVGVLGLTVSVLNVRILRLISTVLIVIARLSIGYGRLGGILGSVFGRLPCKAAAVLILKRAAAFFLPAVPVHGRAAVGAVNHLSFLYAFSAAYAYFFVFVFHVI